MKPHRTQLGNLLRNLGAKTKPLTMVEVGVGWGNTARTMLKAFPKLSYHMVDPWKEFPVKKGGGFDAAKGRSLKEKAYKLLDSQIKLGRCKIHNVTSEEGVKLFEPESMDLIFIDADHRYEFVNCDVNSWWPIVKPGGILSGHDYGGFKYAVEKAVDEWAEQVGQSITNGIGTVWWTKKEV